MNFKGMTGIFNDLEKATHELASELREVRKEYAP